MNVFTKQKQTHRCRKQTCGYQGGKWQGGGGGMNCEPGIDIYTLICIKQIMNDMVSVIKDKAALTTGSKEVSRMK